MVVFGLRTRGRERELEQQRRRPPKTRRDEGSGGNEGIVLDLTLVGDGINSVVYTVPVTVGDNNQAFQLQVDTGSSDLWIASRECSSQSCTANKPRLYDPSSSTPTNVDFRIDYLSGSANGPVVWDRVTIGGYSIEYQALAAASDVTNENLSDDFSGILGLALPLNSIIAKTIPPGTNAVPDGATIVSNLFGMGPADRAPAQFFYSILLGRPNIDRIPSVLGIGRHPSNDLLSDGVTIEPEDVTYSNVIAESNGVLFWKSELRAITVYVNGTVKNIDLGQSITGSVFPQAVLDTGVPYIIATPQIANAVWGALDVSPANDGNYYLPCTTPVNITITLDDRTEIPIHPLDLTAVPNSGGSTCTGLFQQSPALISYNGFFGDIILGVPFLRNVYTVMAYQPPSSDGVVGGGTRGPISPRLGLLNLTEPETALNEFHTVRVLNEPLKGSRRQASSSHGLSTGLKVLFGLLGFIALCGVLFGARWFILRRRAKKAAEKGFEDELTDKDAYALAKYHLAPYRSHSNGPSEDTQRTLADPTSRLEAKYDILHNKTGSIADDELGFRGSRKYGDGGGDDSDGDLGTRVGPGANDNVTDRPKIGDDDRDRHRSWIDSYSEYQPPLLGEWRPPTHDRSYSSSSVTSDRGPSSASPLLDNRRSTLSTMPLEQKVDEFGGLDVGEMVGIGSGRGRRASVILDTDATLTNEPRRHPRSHSREQSHLRPASQLRPQSQLFSNTYPHTHSRTSTASMGGLSGDSRYPTVRPRPRPGRVPSGPRTSSYHPRSSTTMSRAISSGDDVSYRSASDPASQKS